MTREDFEAELRANGFARVGEDTWKMEEQPPEPWARTGVQIRGERYDSLVFFRGGNIGISERGLRFHETRALFSRPWQRGMF